MLAPFPCLFLFPISADLRISLFIELLISLFVCLLCFFV
jgi:hypothetical protein